ncbi:MAG: hypothetical protein IPJ03_20535 [Ignavibacteriales bacterium]|nr:hypothetical protein [Ignavibacteriales bacterium]
MRKKEEIINKGKGIKADIISRQNVENGKYQACKLDHLNPEYILSIKSADTFFLETLQMKANLADKLIWEAETQGKDTTDPNIMRELGEKINAIGTPIHQTESIMTALLFSIKLIGFYAIVIGIWSLVLNKSFLIFCLYGAVTGVLISFLTVVPVIIVKRTKERVRDIIRGASSLLGGIGIIISTIGIIAWIVKLILA